MSIELVVQPNEDIQTYLDIAEQNGGGIVLLNIGTYMPTADIVVPTNVSFGGVSRSACTIDFQGGAYSVLSVGTSLDNITNISIQDITIRNSATNGLYLQYVNNSQIDGVDIFGCDIGYYSDNCVATGVIGQGMFMDSNNSGIKMTNGTANSIYFTTSNTALTGHGLEMIDCDGMTIFDSAFDFNAGDGVNLTNCTGIDYVSLEMLNNTGNGIQLVAGCTNLAFSGTPIKDNGGDGIKITDTCDRNAFGDITIMDNGGYGANVANANCNNNIFTGINTLNNSSGALNDLGTNTLTSALVNNFI